MKSLSRLVNAFQPMLGSNGRSALYCLALGLTVILVSACAGVRTFPTPARAGSTVALELGWAQHLTRQNMTIRITDSAGAITLYFPGDSRVRAVYNDYPDPVSRLIVGAQTNQDMGYNAVGAAVNINGKTGSDPDWSQTTLLMDLPTSMATGLANISVNGQSGQVTPNPIQIYINGTGASPTQFDTQTNGNINLWVPLIERAPHYKVSFSGSVVPHSVQLTLTHTSGVGVPWVVNPRGDIKNVTWTDNGSVLQVMLTPVNGLTPNNMLNFKFYVAGGITNLAATDIKAYDVNGYIIPGITPQIASQ